MRTPLVLLKAILNAVGGGVLGEILIDALPEIANNVLDDWAKQQDAAERRAELEGVAQLIRQDVGEQLKGFMRQHAPEASPQLIDEAAAYLNQVPAAVRRSLRRADDPSGTTVPAGLALRKGEDLLPFLPARMPRFKPGDRPLAGVDWVLAELLGIGGYGEVWKAVHDHQIEGFEPVALKFCIDPSAQQRLLTHEARVCAQVRKQGRHAGIVALEQTYLSADPPCLQYEYVAGGDLAGLIREWHRTASPPTPNQAARVVLRLCETVGYFHRLTPRIIHRDLKPANILTQRTNSDIGFKIADFGIGGIASAQAVQVSRHGASVGYLMTSLVRGSCTPMYASPPQLHGAEPDPWDDVHALGVIWHQILTGDLGQGRPTCSRWWNQGLAARGMAPDLIDLLESCFEDEPSVHPADASVLAERLAAALATTSAPAPSEPAVAPAAPPSAPVPKPPPSSPRPAGAVKVSAAPPWKGSKAGAVSVVRVKDLEVRFRWCPPTPRLKPFRLSSHKPLRMGSPKTETGRNANENQVKVILSRGFWMQEVPVTQGLWQAVMGMKHDWSREWEAPNLPVYNVNHGEAEAFSATLTERLREGQQLPAGWKITLPTEAQWEYASRAGTTGRFPFGEDESKLGEYSWFKQNSGGKPHEVKTRKPNDWGLHDMLGNVWEWCVDAYQYKLPGGSDPCVLAKAADRVSRGGSWLDDPSYCRPALRYRFTPEDRRVYLGLRLAAVQQ
jgi:serine/threonine protein kinase